MTDPQREHALELARKHYNHYHIPFTMARCEKCADVNSLADLLLEFAREAREDEAKWWHMQRGHHGRNWCCERVESLQQPAKKGTQP